MEDILCDEIAKCEKHLFCFPPEKKLMVDMKVYFFARPSHLEKEERFNQRRCCKKKNYSLSFFLLQGGFAISCFAK